MQQSALVTQVESDSFAVFDEKMAYRYRLVRVFDKPDTRRVVFVMLNPSTADAFKDDPTVTRCREYAKQWGFTSLEVVNIFALRSTDPKVLYSVSDPIGMHNDRVIMEAIRDEKVNLVVAAWGTHGKLRDRGRLVAQMIKMMKAVHCLKKTKDGHPGHPLYLKASLTPQLF